MQFSFFLIVITDPIEAVKEFQKRTVTPPSAPRASPVPEEEEEVINIPNIDW